MYVVELVLHVEFSTVVVFDVSVRLYSTDTELAAQVSTNAASPVCNAETLTIVVGSITREEEEEEDDEDEDTALLLVDEDIDGMAVLDDM